MRMRFCIPIAILVIFALGLGCSGNPGVMDSMDKDDIRGNSTAGSHHCFGLWQMVADPAEGTLDVIELREAMMHLNALPFLEPPALLNLSLEHIEFIGNTELIADIGLRHPFLGLTEFSGFDVCGILISNGNGTFGNTGLSYAMGDDTYLLNPDGYTRWWNPEDFPQDGTISAYKDGLLGTPDSVGNFNTDLNGYKYYSDELSNLDNILECTPANRGLFSAGSKNIRRFHINLGTEGLVFNYAVDANWQFPSGAPPYTAPDDFALEANRPEAWAMSFTELENTLYNDGVDSGGDLSLLIYVYDHFNAWMNAVRVDSPGNFPNASTMFPVGSGDGYSTYQIDITDATPAEDSIPLFIIIESEVFGYGGNIPSEAVTAFFTGSVSVSDETGCVVHVDDDNVSGPWDGSATNPFRYLQDAVDAVPDNCTIRVHPGQYNETNQVTINGITNVIIEGIDNPVIHPPSNSLDAKAAIRITGSCPGLVIDGLEIMGEQTYEAAFWLTNADDVTIQNCIITPTTTPMFSNAILANYCDNLVVSGCTFDGYNGWNRNLIVISIGNSDNALVTLNSCVGMNTDFPGVANTTESFVTLDTCTNSEVSKNRFGEHELSATASSSGGYVHGYFIRIQNGSNNTVRNNLLYDVHVENTNYPNSYNYGFRLQGCPNLKVYNNTIDNMGPTKTSDDSGGTYGIIDFGGCTGIEIYNNTVTNLYHYRGSVGIYEYSGGVPTYNCVWNMMNVIGSSSRYVPSGIEGDGDLDADPLFSDPDNGDYTLGTGSPCIEAGRIGGVSTGAPTNMGCHGGSDPLPTG
jgi:hypothetical protein